MKLFLFLLLTLGITNSFGQRGKDGAFTATSLNQVVNTYTKLASNSNAGMSTLNVENSALTGANFSTNLAQGDLVMVVQMRGVDAFAWDASNLNIYVYDAFVAAQGGHPGITSVNSHQSSSYQNGQRFGKVSNYGNVGNFELREVLSVVGNTITLTCPLENTYEAGGVAQVIRVPRYTNLTINAGASIVCPNWNGNSGGVLAIEVDGNLINNAVGGINANARGFRPGLALNSSATGNSTPHNDGQGNGSTALGTNNGFWGALKGESIVGDTTKYSEFFSQFGRGAIANGGGGGGMQNSGGGGGSNIGDTVGHTGKGIPQLNGAVANQYVIPWNLERPGMATSVSGGGGRGGYSYSTSSQNPLTQGPNRSAWGGDARKENGGYGGHGLVYHPRKMFLGGGGGAGGQDSGQAGSGGFGGGIIHLTVYGNISGNGTIEANGGAGQNSNPANQTTSFSNPRRGNDGAGGGGGGGFITIKNSNPIPASMAINARGGKGGDHNLLTSTFSSNLELCGPGGGGAGGGISIATGTASINVSGGLSGGTFANGGQNTQSASFPMNGATGGGVGMGNLTNPTFDITAANSTICGNSSATLTATVTGSLPSGGTVTWYTAPFGGTVAGTGLTFNTPTLSSSTTYYVGVCPGTFRKPVVVTVGASPVISGTAVITDASCNTGGSLTGLSVSGGLAPYTYTWNGASASGPTLTNVSPDSYTLVVSDQNGCSATSGPYVISGGGGPTITGTVVIADATCTAQGSISGLVVTAPAGVQSYEWNGTTSSNANLTAGVGSYTLVVTDNNGCTVTSGPHAINLIAGPTVGGTPLVSNQTCINGGAISGITVSGGVGPYAYTWSNTTQTTLDITGLTANSYTLTITDANGCVVTSGPHVVALDAVPSISGTPTIVHETCLALGSITGLTVSGGVGTLSYEWNGITASEANLAAASAGFYTLVVTDQNGCTATSGPHTITAPVLPTIEGSPIITPITCTVPGTITGLSASGGSAPYNYLWNSMPATVNLSTTITGNYTLTVIDANGCSVTSGPHTVGEAATPAFSGTPIITDVTCNSLGSITGINVSGGAAPYTYEWNGVGSTSIDLLNVGAGAYTLVVEDANGCTLTSGPHTVSAQGSLPTISGTPTIVSATCLTGGSISGLVVTGGQAPYSYEWNGVVSTNTNLANAAPGTYILEVEDDNGCVATSQTFTIDAPDTPTITGNPVIQNASCLAGGSINGLNVTGGTAPYTYSWNNGLYTTLNIANLTVGQYTLTVTDANGCTITGLPITVGEDVLVDAQFSYTPQPVMINELVSFHDESFGNIVQWNWVIDTTVITVQHPNYTFSKEGFYNVTLTVVDANGCTDFITVTIEVVSETIVPNVITANGDGVNDFLVFKGLVPNTSLLILNRWGNVIYQTNNYDNSWNGKDMSGNFVTEGVYTYSISIPNGNKKHGFIHVVGGN